MVMLVQFIVTLWQSKYGMLRSLIANKDTIRAMCASDDDECKPLHDKDLSDAEWKTLEVRFVLVVFVRNAQFLILAMQESLPIFKTLAELTKFMEGEKYVLSSSYWVALSTIEGVVAPNPADSLLLHCYESRDVS